MKIILPYPPSLNRLYRSVNGGVKLSEVGRQYKKDVAKACLAQRVKSTTEEVAVHIHAYRPAKRGDLDNTLKALLDSIQGIAYENDSQIGEIHAKRFEDKKNPRVEITITPLLT